VVSGGVINGGVTVAGAIGTNGGGMTFMNGIPTRDLPAVDVYLQDNSGAVLTQTLNLAVLDGGTATFTVEFFADGTSAITAQDTTDNTKTSATSATITY